jgi:hypothetical protein
MVSGFAVAARASPRDERGLDLKIDGSDHPVGCVAVCFGAFPRLGEGKGMGSSSIG